MTNVHTRHCCILDGCKYNELACPVWLGIQEQEFKCEKCPQNFTKPNLTSTTQKILFERREKYNLSIDY